MRGIAQLVREKKIEGIKDIRDESNREGIRVSIDLKNGVEPETIKDNYIKIHKSRVHLVLIL
jgi:DNA gyrase subunit A